MLLTDTAELPSMYQELRSPNHPILIKMQMISPNRCSYFRSSQIPTNSGKSALMHRSHHCSPGSMPTAGCICPHTECPWRKHGIHAFHAPQNDTYTRLNNFENTKHSSRLGSQSVDYIYSSHLRLMECSCYQDSCPAAYKFS